MIKKLLAVFLTAVLILGLLPMGILTVSAQTPILTANIRIAVPTDGEHPDFSPVSDNEDEYYATVETWYLYEESYPTLYDDSIFELGKKYALRVYFTAKDGYEFTEDTKFKINNQSTSCFGSASAREIIYEVSATEFNVSTEQELIAALGKITPVKKINIVSDMSINSDCTILYDAEHIDNYHDTVLTIKKNVVVTLNDDGFLGSFWPSYEGDWQSEPLPCGKLINNGGIIIKKGGGVIADFDTNNGEVIIENGGECVCANTNNGSIYVERGGIYQTTQGQQAINNGTVNVAPEATMQSRFGSTIINAEGGTINLDGVFVCGCVGFDEDIMWFENHGTVNGEGSIVLYEVDRSIAPVSDMDGLIEKLMNQLGQETRFENWEDVNILKLVEVQNFEELAAELPGDRIVAGEHVEGDMDVMVLIETDMVIPEEESIETMGTLIVSGGASLTVENGAILECNIQNNASIEVMYGGSLYTTMGGYIKNSLNMTIHEGGLLVSQMGSSVINEENATLTLDGEFLCGCIGLDGNDGFWFENHGTVNGQGDIILYEADRSILPVSNMDALIEEMMGQLGQETRFENWEDVNIYKLVFAENYEEIVAALPGNRVVADENVPGDMDVKIAILDDIVIPEGEEISTMAALGIPEEMTLTVSNGATLECGIENEGTIYVLHGGALYTTMGGDINNYGEITVYEGAEIKSQMGGVVKNKKSGTLIINGKFLCGCVGFDGNDNCWFENSGTVNGTGVILLDELDPESMAISDMDALVAAVKAAIADSGEPQPKIRAKGKHTSGDITGDDEIDNKDFTRLFQYLSEWDDIEVNEAALDVNGDGSVDNKDLTRLFQYLSGWDVEIF